MVMLPLLKVLLLLFVDTELLLLWDPPSPMDMLPVVAMLLTLLELSMLPREKLMLMLMPSTVLMDTAVLVILVLDTLAMVMLLQLFLMAILLLLLPLLLIVMLPLHKVLLLLSVATDMLPVVAMLLTLSELSILPRERLKQNLKLMLFMHLMETVVLDTTGFDTDLDTEDLGTLVLDTPDLMALDMDILTTAKLFNRSSTANL